MQSLNPTVNPYNWSYYVKRRTDPNFIAFAEKAFSRDKYTCQFCGFIAREHLEVINKDGNYQNNKLDNMLTSCPFCAQCLFVETVGQLGYGGGKLVFLPEMTQPQLNALCHVLFCAITNGTGYRDTAQTIYRTFKLRSKPIEEKYGEYSSEPGVFGHMMIENTDLNKDLIKNIFRDFRLLPSFSKFSKELKRWAELASEEMKK